MEGQLVNSVYVATSNPDDNNHNTIALGNIEVVIPLEADLDGDPDTPDCVRLTNDDGAYQCDLTVGGPNVEQDGSNPLYYYHFQYVPVGQYSVQVKVGDTWNTVLCGLQIGFDGAFVGDVSIEGTTDGSVLGTPEWDLVDDLPDEPDLDLGCC